MPCDPPDILYPFASPPLRRSNAPIGFLFRSPGAVVARTFLPRFSPPPLLLVPFKTTPIVLGYISFYPVVLASFLCRVSGPSPSPLLQNRPLLAASAPSAPRSPPPRPGHFMRWPRRTSFPCLKSPRLDLLPFFFLSFFFSFGQMLLFPLGSFGKPVFYDLLPLPTCLYVRTLPLFFL